jgi:predicted dehydrogenase
MAAVMKVLVAGIGGMGASHALGYTRIPGFKVAGFVVAKNVDRAKKLAADLKLSIPIYTDYYKAMAEVKPDVVSINTLADTHAPYSIHAMRQGCHIFMEKPIAKTVAEAEEVARVAAETKRKLVIGYILRVHPAWKKFIELAQTLGKPLIMRMNLNQQSYGHEWEVHKSFIANMPPLVDCGVHYVDVMCQMTRAKPKIVQGMAARVSDEIGADEENYGALQVVFDDKSVGWYEVGWGPMMSKVAFFVKDVIGPKGCVSIDKDLSGVDPSDVSKHTTVDSIIVHSSAHDASGMQTKKDEVVRITDEPDHNELCRREQEY